MCRSRAKWSNPGKEIEPSPTFQVVAIEKVAIGSLSTTVANLLFNFTIPETTLLCAKKK